MAPSFSATPFATQTRTRWSSSWMTSFWLWSPCVSDLPQLPKGTRSFSAWKRLCWCFCRNSERELCRGDGWAFPLHDQSAAFSRFPPTTCQKDPARGSALGCNSISASGWEQKGDTLIPPPQSKAQVPAPSPWPGPCSPPLPQTPLSWLRLLGSGAGAEPAPVLFGLGICHGRDSVV